MILVTGGAGYIGTHTCVTLSQANQEFIILDNFSNSSRQSINRLTELLGQKPLCIEGDVRDASMLASLFKAYPISAVIHFAAFKYVGESVGVPLNYYDNNVIGLITLLNVMQQTQVRDFVFSSSCTVYGNPQQMPVTEESPIQAINPYGHSKIMCEQILADLKHASPDWRIARLRYFNPIGAHESGLIGEEPQGIPNTLLPYMSKVAAKELPYLRIFGDDYPTIDGTPVRDYLHVMDLAEGHVTALDYIKAHGESMLTVNLGTGVGYSVLQMVKSFEKASGLPLPYKIEARRPGDAAQCWAKPALAQKLLNWQAKRSLDQMLEDAWRWQRYLESEE